MELVHGVESLGELRSLGRRLHGHCTHVDDGDELLRETVRVQVGHRAGGVESWFPENDKIILALSKYS